MSLCAIKDSTSNVVIVTKSDVNGDAKLEIRRNGFRTRQMRIGAEKTHCGVSNAVEKAIKRETKCSTSVLINLIKGLLNCIMNE